MKSLVVDSDTASDDAVALLMAARSDTIDLRAITTVAGNVDVDRATRNALITLELAGCSDVPVHQGIGQPLLRWPQTADFVHGSDGMSGVEFADPRSPASETHAVDALLAIARTEPDRHTLVTLGPLTNIATAISCDPSFLERFADVIAMGGAFDGVGNVHPVGEYNIWADPEAAAIVVDAPGSVTFVGWDISRRRAVMTADDQNSLRAMGRYGKFAVDINRCVDDYARETSGLDGCDLPDPIAMAVAMNPRVATEIADVNLEVGTDEARRGGTFIGRHPGAVPNARLVVDADEDAFKAMLFDACREDNCAVRSAPPHRTEPGEVDSQEVVGPTSEVAT